MTYKEWIRDHAPPIWSAEDVWKAAQEAYKKEHTEAEKACIAVYMSIHVSQIDRMRTSVRNAWEVGQKLWEEMTK